MFCLLINFRKCTQKEPAFILRLIQRNYVKDYLLPMETGHLETGILNSRSLLPMYHFAKLGYLLCLYPLKDSFRLSMLWSPVLYSVDITYIT